MAFFCDLCYVRNKYFFLSEINKKKKKNDTKVRALLFFFYLGFVIRIGAVLDQQVRHVVMTLLRAQMQRGETRFGLRVSVRAVLQESGGNIHLSQDARNFAKPSYLH